MAKIVDPDQLNQGTEVVFSTGGKTAQLLVAGNLNDTAPGQTSGVSGKAFYSFVKEEWKDDATLRRFRPPIQMIYEASFIWINGWAPADQQTRDLFRDAGMQEQTSGRENACIISLGAMDDAGADLAYYQQVTGFNQTTANFDKTGELNENIQVFDGGVNDYRDYLKVFLREFGKLYAEYNLLTEQGLAALTYQAYRLPLSNGTDLKINDSIVNIDGNAPYTGMKINYLKGVGFTTYANTTVYPASAVVFDAASGNWYFTVAGGTSNGANVAADIGVTWELYDGQEDIGGINYVYNRVITGNGGTAQQIYNWAQRQLIKTTDINANDTTSINQRGFGTVNGNVAALVLGYVGDDLITSPGVLIRGFDVNDQNSIKFSDVTVDGGGLDAESVPVTSTQRTYPFVAAGTLEFSSNLVAEPDANTRYSMYFEYITRVTNSTIAVGTPTGNTVALTWTGTALDHLQTGDYIKTSGFSNAQNNGFWSVDSTGANTMTCTKLGATAPVTEIAGAAVTVDENPYESAGAILVQDNSLTNIDGQITAASISWDFDYDNNVQGGRTAGTNAAVVVSAQGLAGSQIVITTSTITRTTGQAIPVNANDELNYENP